ncbi:hypothetical protein [Haloprofundus sp. MHR1]|uniref:hypothetical protein n=1 Tax=Haloprofundus sp. MHR1 TaxID=2572921 RepID=UPI0010BF0B1D|nr:hypothetical protein [Haloprofundus sp. MHR1]QCJ47941.1 hypothetical protein FCF25_12805 [Haloprofundus sp. MHR1]
MNGSFLRFGNVHWASKVAFTVATVLLGYSLFAALSVYPLTPEPRHGDGMGLQLLLLFPPAIVAGLVAAVVLRREFLPSALKWRLLYPIGAIAGLVPVVAYLGLSPNWSGSVGNWVQMAGLLGGFVTFVGEVASW